MTDQIPTDILATAERSVPKQAHGRSACVLHVARAIMAERERNNARIAYLEAALKPFTQLPDAARDVLAERRRQIEAEGWSAAHDNRHQNNSLTLAAISYALASIGGYTTAVHEYWPWDIEQWKPKDNRADKVRATALLIAAIERDDRIKVEIKGEG
jgi:hypothetical protein